MPGVGFTPNQIECLSAKLDKAHVKSREQAGRTLSYVEGWHAIAEANRIFGFDAWTRETLECKCVSERERKIGREPRTRDGWGVSYTARVRVNVNGVVREGVGAGHGIDVDCGLAHESAIKEAETDAMKRALMTFGNPFGLALYDKEQANVDDGRPAPVAANGEPLPDSVVGLISTFRRAKSIRDLEAEQAKNKAFIGSLADAEYEAVADAFNEMHASLSKPARKAA